MESRQPPTKRKSLENPALSDIYYFPFSYIFLSNAQELNSHESKGFPTLKTYSAIKDKRFPDKV